MFVKTSPQLLEAKKQIKVCLFFIFKIVLERGEEQRERERERERERGREGENLKQAPHSEQNPTQGLIP